MQAWAPAILVLVACVRTEAVPDAVPLTRVDLGVLRHPFEPREARVRIVHDGAEDWELDDVRTSCGCLRVLSLSRRVGPSAELELGLIYEPRGMRGPFAQSLSLGRTMDRSPLIVEVVGSVVPAPFVTPESLSLASDAQAGLELTLPWSEAEVEVGGVPPGLELCERERAVRHGALIVAYALRPRSTPPVLGERASLRFLVRTPDESFELSVPVLPLSPAGSRSLP